MQSGKVTISVSIVLVFVCFSSASQLPPSIVRATEGNDSENSVPDVAKSSLCPEHWIPNGAKTKCLFIDPNFFSSTFFETAAFCQSIGGKLVEPKTMSDLKEIEAFVKQPWEWTDGPWIGVIRKLTPELAVFGLSAVGSEQQEYRDGDLISVLQAAAINQNGSRLANCAGYSGNGHFDFWDCKLGANPFCERPISRSA